jgi:hypothetical protein
MKKDLVIAMTGIRSRVGRALAARLRAEGHTVVPVPRNYGILPGSAVFIHLGRGSRRLAARLPDAVLLPEKLITTSARWTGAQNLGVPVTPVRLEDLKPDDAADLILWAVQHVEGRLELERV